MKSREKKKNATIREFEKYKIDGVEVTRRQMYWHICIRLFAVLMTLNGCITATIDSFKHPQLTSMQLFQRIPQTFIYNFTK